MKQQAEVVVEVAFAQLAVGGSGTHGATERFFNQYGIHLNTGMEISSNEAIKQSVQAGLGLGLLSRDTLEMEMELALNKLVVLDVEGFPIMRHWYVIHRRAKRLPPVAQAFKQFLLEEANTLLHPDLPGSRPRNRESGAKEG